MMHASCNMHRWQHSPGEIPSLLYCFAYFVHLNCAVMLVMAQVIKHSCAAEPSSLLMQPQTMVGARYEHPDTAAAGFD